MTDKTAFTELSLLAKHWIQSILGHLKKTDLTEAYHHVT